MGGIMSVVHSLNPDFLPISTSEYEAPHAEIVYTHPHRMDVSIRRFPLSHLYGCDAQGPDVSQTVVADLLDHLWGHPERSTNDSVSLCHGVLWILKTIATKQKEILELLLWSSLRFKTLKYQICNLTKFVIIESKQVTVSCPATPKSASLACPSVLRRMFPALMSRWIFLMKWRYSRPFSVDFRIVAISSSVNWWEKEHRWN